MAKRLYLLDFDRTIFDNHRFINDVVDFLKNDRGLDIERFHATFDQFVDHDHGGYDPHAHHQELLGISPDELDRILRKGLGGRDYAFPDAAAWIKARDPERDHVVVITVGRPRYQAIKFHHTPVVKDLRKIVVRTNKGAVLRHHLTQGAGEYGLDFLDQHYDSISLIDDSAETFTALGPTDRISGIRIARPGEKYSDIPTPPFVRHITSFGDLS
ncbi:MAG: hypothetical protein K0S68_380 [Candidatus Saccharibacteria bacterium]|jgi:hypothetical protein|nr:hypothetical protein [Candidatus Saccharibacteria bacterium]